METFISHWHIFWVGNLTQSHLRQGFNRRFCRLLISRARTSFLTCSASLIVIRVPADT